ncbi:DUF4296 domain-containing protein [Lacinutrix chionoecetis]
MKLKQIAILFSLLVLSACYKVEKPEKPKNLISKDKMVNILVDMAVLSAAKGVNKSKLEQNGILPTEYIYKKNNIDSATFAESNTYYAFDIKTYDAIYARVKDSLTMLRNQYEAKEKKERREKEIKDSINRAKVKAEKRKNYDKNTKPGMMEKGDLTPLKTN